MSWWYLSFKDGETREFLGGAVIEAQGPDAARERALDLIEHHDDRCVEVVAFGLKNIPEDRLPSPPNRNRLLTHEELARELGETVRFTVEGGKLVEVKDN